MLGRCRAQKPRAVPSLIKQAVLTPWMEKGGMNHARGCRTAGVVVPAHCSPHFQRQHSCYVSDHCSFPAAWQVELLHFGGVIASIVYCHSSDEMSSLNSPVSVQLYALPHRLFLFSFIIPIAFFRTRNFYVN